MTGWAVEIDDRERLQRGRRRLVVLLTAAVVVPCLLVGSLLLAAERRSGERLRLHGVALIGRTWYLTSVVRLGRTWTPQGLSTLTFPGDRSAVTFDGASATYWAVDFGGGKMRSSIHGEREAAAGGPISYEIGQAVEAAFKGHTSPSLVGDKLRVSGSRGTLQYAPTAPSLAPTGTVTIRVEATILGKARAVPATRFAEDSALAAVRTLAATRHHSNAR